MNETLDSLDNEYGDVKDSVVVMHLGPTAQLLNMLMFNARVALQLCARKGFEDRVAEALHKGVPVIASLADGTLLQVLHEESGSSVEAGDCETVAKYLDVLFSDERRYDQMSEFAAGHVSDEVETVETVETVENAVN